MRWDEREWYDYDLHDSRIPNVWWAFWCGHRDSEQLNDWHFSAIGIASTLEQRSVELARRSVRLVLSGRPTAVLYAIIHYIIFIFDIIFNRSYLVCSIYIYLNKIHMIINNYTHKLWVKNFNINLKKDKYKLKNYHHCHCLPGPGPSFRWMTVQ